MSEYAAPTLIILRSLGRKCVFAINLAYKVTASVGPAFVSAFAHDSFEFPRTTEIAPRACGQGLAVLHGPIGSGKTKKDFVTVGHVADRIHLNRS